jgi:cysteine-rich repeat protein
MNSLSTVSLLTALLLGGCSLLLDAPPPADAGLPLVLDAGRAPTPECNAEQRLSTTANWCVADAPGEGADCVPAEHLAGHAWLSGRTPIRVADGAALDQALATYDPATEALLLATGPYDLSTSELPAGTLLVAPCAAQTELTGLSALGAGTQIWGLHLSGSITTGAGVRLEQVRLSAENGDAIHHASGTLHLDHVTFAAIGHDALTLGADALLDLTGSHFLGPIGHDGISIGNLGGTHHIATSTFTAIANDALAVSSGSGTLNVTENQFLGPIGHDGISTGNLGGTHHINGNTFAAITRNGLFIAASSGTLNLGGNSFLGPIGHDGISIGNLGGTHHINGNTFSAVLHDGLFVGEGTGSLNLSENQFLGPIGHDGISIHNLQPIEGSTAIGNNTIGRAGERIGRVGLLMTESNGSISLTGNTITGCDAEGIVVQNVSSGSLTISGNTITNAHTAGVLLLQIGVAVALESNLLEGTLAPEIGGDHEVNRAAYGMLILDSGSLNFDGNTVRNNTGAGLVVDLRHWGEVDRRPELSGPTNLNFLGNQFSGHPEDSLDVVVQNTPSDIVIQGDLSVGSRGPDDELLPVDHGIYSADVCGNGELDNDEACDDGNRVDTDACTNDCQPAACGDNIVSLATEDCDGGTPNTDPDCNDDCMLIDSPLFARGDQHLIAVPIELNTSVTGLGNNEHGQVQPGGEPQVIGNVSTDLFPQEPNAVYAGAAFSCARTRTGRAMCWGHNDRGQTGQESNESVRPVGFVVDNDGGIVLFGVRQLSLGSASACARLVDGSLWCWGDNSYRLINDPDAQRLLTATPRLDLGREVRSVAVGDGHACVLRDNHTIWCFGRADSGQVGPNGNREFCTDMVTRCLPAATQVSRLEFATLAAGAEHTCAIKAGESSTVFCWGKNNHGQTDGNAGGISAISQPTAVGLPGGETAKSLALGRLHTCALTTTGGVRCWGNNEDHQIISAQEGLAELSTGKSATCVLDANQLNVSCAGTSLFGGDSHILDSVFERQ